MAQVGDIVRPLVGWAIGPNDASAVDREDNGQLLDANIVDDLIEGTLEEGGIDRCDGANALTGHTCS